MSKKIFRLLPHISFKSCVTHSHSTDSRMLTLMLLVSLTHIMLPYMQAWDDYYPDITEDITEYANKTYTNDERLATNEANVWISNSYFHDMASASSGGAMYVSSCMHLLCETTTFANCMTSMSGAAIYVGRGNTVLYKVCGTGCTSSDLYGFAYIDVSNNEWAMMNYVIETSVISCTSADEYMIYNAYGYVKHELNNVSCNKAEQYSSAIVCIPSVCDSSTGLGTRVTQCTFSNNTAGEAYCIEFDYMALSASQYEVSTTSIVGNLGEYTVCNYRGDLEITGCCILENNASVVFYTSSMIVLQACCFDKFSGGGGGELTVRIITSCPLDYITFSHYVTGNCNTHDDITQNIKMTLNPRPYCGVDLSQCVTKRLFRI